MHANAALIERLYTSIRDNQPDVAADCYASEAYFEDIAFRRENRKEIREMWELVCSSIVELTFGIDAADDTRGHAHWVARYPFHPFPLLPARCVTNKSVSKFEFRDGKITRHEDHADPMVWAKQAYPFPISHLIGRSVSLRRFGAKMKLQKFLRKQQMQRLLHSG